MAKIDQELDGARRERTALRKMLGRREAAGRRQGKVVTHISHVDLRAWQDGRKVRINEPRHRGGLGR